MDYIDAFKNLKTNNKYGRKSPHKAVLMLTVIELFEQNVISDNVIYYNETLKSTFLSVWNRVLPNEPLFHPEAYFPFWYLQSDSFWHIVPIRGQEDILSLMRDTNIKPSETKIINSVKYAELDEDLFFLMTLSSGRSSLKRTLLESYTSLSEEEIDKLSRSPENTIDNSTSARTEYEKMLLQDNIKRQSESVEINELFVRQFHELNEDVQLVLNIEYYSFLKKHHQERDLFRDICPTVYDLLDKIVNNPIKQGEISPSFAIIYDNFLSDLKISLMSEDYSMELIEKISEAIDLLRGNNTIFEDSDSEKEDIVSMPSDNIIEQKIPIDNNQDTSYEKSDFEGVYLEKVNKKADTISSTTSVNTSEKAVVEDRRGMPWTENEEELITLYFKQGKDIAEIAQRVGRTEVSIMSRLGKLGLIVFS